MHGREATVLEIVLVLLFASTLLMALAAVVGRVAAQRRGSPGG
jgi:hypothetical protein